MLDLTQQPDRPLVAASILACDFGRAADDAHDALRRGADLLHVDVMDGHFVPNLTMGADMIRGLRQHLPGALLDVHLMVERPWEYLDAFADAGANVFSFHVEIEMDHAALIQRIRQRGLLAGLVINPPTPVERMLELVARPDLVLVMSVNPGYGGQSFMPETLEKARTIAPRLTARQRLEMDGGLNGATGPRAVAAGVDVLVAGSHVFGRQGEARAAAIASVRG